MRECSWQRKGEVILPGRYKVEKNKSFFEKWGMPVGAFALGVLVTLGSKSAMNYIGKQR